MARVYEVPSRSALMWECQMFIDRYRSEGMELNAQELRYKYRRFVWAPFVDDATRDRDCEEFEMCYRNAHAFFHSLDMGTI